MSRASSDPVRTCVGCRRRDDQAALVRVVAGAGEPPVAAVDARRRLPGRGAWLHPVEACLATALQRRALQRALRRPDLDPSGLQVDHLRSVVAPPTLGNAGPKA